MNPEKLRQIQQALTRTFVNNPSATPCPRLVHAHLIYSHLPALVDPRALLPLDHTDFETRVDAWVFPTLFLYDLFSWVAKYIDPYRDFITARFLWKELEGVRISNLPANAVPPISPGHDGGTIIGLFTGWGFVPPSGKNTVQVTITAPAAQNNPAGYPTIRRICLSGPGERGVHAEINTPDAPSSSAADMAYPFSNVDSVLHLCAVMPHFRFELRSRTDSQVESITEDPWTHRIAYNTEMAGFYGWDFFESTTNTRIGGISRYSGRYFGVNQTGTEDAKNAVRSGYAEDLSPSRRLVLCAVMGVEGGPDAVGTTDGPKMSWGMNQWTIPAGAQGGELAQILCFIYDFFPTAFERCFGRYGIGVYFDGRQRAWSTGAYRNTIIYRVPCCPSRAGLDALRGALSREASPRAMAHAYQIQRQDTTSCAMIYLFFKAGGDAEIQEAQVQWTSYRISYAMRNLQNPTNDQVLEAFLTSLGSNIDAASRRLNANAALEDARSAGVSDLPDLQELFSDDGTTQPWRDWEQRCTAANKTLLAAAPSHPANRQQSAPARPQAAPLHPERPAR